MRNRTVVLVAGLVVAAAMPAHAQGQATFLAMQPTKFESWSWASTPRPDEVAVTTHPVARARPPGRNALIGGAIGALAGVALCTAFSNLMNEGSAGFSTCTRDGYLLFGSAGFALGFAVGWAL